MRSFSLKHLIPLIILLSIAIILYILGLSNHFTLGTIKAKEALIFSWIHVHPLLSALCLSLLYILSICLLIPASTVLTLFAGMTYPPPYALAISIISETIGNCLFFIILRFAFSPVEVAKKNICLGKAENHFKMNPASYLLFLRLSHLTPSWFIGTLAAIFKAKLFTFAWTTFLGSAPICYLAVQAGRVLKHSSKTYHTFNWHEFFNTDMKLLFLALGLLSLSPILVKKLMKR